jgi:hypothetical protein
MRFFLIAALVKKFGPTIRVFIEKYMNWVALGLLLVILAGFYVVLR